MCVFAAKDYRCLLQKLSSKNYEFKKTDILRCIERTTEYAYEWLVKNHLEVLSKPYSCYRVWEPRGRNDFLMPGERVDHYSELQSAVSRKCLDAEGNITATSCPKFNGTRICKPHGWEFFDPQCPLLKDHTFKLKCGYLYTLRNIIAAKEIAFKIRTISKRRIECDAAYNIALRLTWKQAVLWWLKMLGPDVVPMREMEVIAGVGKTNFVNTLYGVPNKKGFRYGGAVSKVEKVLRHRGFDDPFIKAFCLEAFKLVSLDFHRPAYYLEAVQKNRMVSLSDIEFGVFVGDEHWSCWTWKDKDAINE